MAKNIRVGVIGASGYTGLELIKIILNHPIFSLSYIANTSGNQKVDKLHPMLSSLCDLEVKKIDINECACACDLVFLALPHKTSMECVKPLLALGVKIVDLSADYRLPQDIYEEFYCPHTDIKNLQNVVYGLPELFRDKIKNTNLVANPGCFPTSVLLGLLPFMSKRIKNTPIIIDAKTGVSGAGKKLSDNTHFVNINDNLFAYNPFSHRHAPEIANKLNISLEEISFVPHIVPTTRGMISSIYMQVDDGFDENVVIEDFYKNEPFIRIRTTPVDMKSVNGTNFCDIYVKKERNMLFISSSIDNLLRGASSQAVVNANIMMGFDEKLAIPMLAYAP